MTWVWRSIILKPQWNRCYRYSKSTLEYRRGLAQYVHFSTHALNWGHQKFVSQFSQPIFNNFHILIAYDTTKSLDCIMVPIFFKIFLQLFSKLTYSFVAIDFLCFSKKMYSICTPQNSSQICGSIFWGD